MPNMPDLLTGPPDDPDSVLLALPDNSSVPPPHIPGVDLQRGVAAVVPGGYCVAQGCCSQADCFGSTIHNTVCYKGVSSKLSVCIPWQHNPSKAGGLMHGGCGPVSNMACVITGGHQTVQSKETCKHRL